MKGASVFSKRGTLLGTDYSYGRRRQGIEEQSQALYIVTTKPHPGSWNMRAGSLLRSVRFSFCRDLFDGPPPPGGGLRFSLRTVIWIRFLRWGWVKGRGKVKQRQSGLSGFSRFGIRLSPFFLILSPHRFGFCYAMLCYAVVANAGRVLTFSSPWCVVCPFARFSTARSRAEPSKIDSRHLPGLLNFLSPLLHTCRESCTGEERRGVLIREYEFVDRGFVGRGGSLAQPPRLPLRFQQAEDIVFAN